MQAKGYILVEGHGEVEAVQNLVERIAKTTTHPPIPWSTPRRWPNLHQWQPLRGKGGLENGVEFIRSRPDAAALLILRDEDDACPKDLAPKVAERLRDRKLPFPVAYVLLHPEYEVLFLPCLDRMIGTLPDGRAGLLPETRWDRDSWEVRRGVKEWLSKHYPPQRVYKPTLDQLPLTRKIDLEVLRQANVPSFGSLERGIRTLLRHQGKSEVVYPPSGPTEK